MVNGECTLLLQVTTGDLKNQRAKARQSIFPNAFTMLRLSNLSLLCNSFIYCIIPNRRLKHLQKKYTKLFTSIIINKASVILTLAKFSKTA